jgi:phosphoglycerol geranylgeranyltransferase
MILNQLTTIKGGRKAFIWLVDPDKCPACHLESQTLLADRVGVDLVFTGGSLVYHSLDSIILRIKELTDIPVVLFPGSPLQLSRHADGILLLSLISGRNAEYLIGNHVIAAPFIKGSGLKIIPTGYILVDGGCETSVSYMSNSRPIPADKPDIAVATAMAGEMLGLKVLYMDAGSGAINRIPPKMIEAVASEISIPLIIGGGLRTPSDIREAYAAGADAVVVGNAAEAGLFDLGQLVAVRDSFNT